MRLVSASARLHPAWLAETRSRTGLRESDDALVVQQRIRLWTAADSSRHISSRMSTS
jgi:hypothetical protein